MGKKREQIDATALRKDLFATLKRVAYDGPIEICRNGRIIAVLMPPPPEVRTEKPTYDPRRLARICKKHHIAKVALFGSMLRDDFGPDSDVDLLIDPEPGQLETLLTYFAAEEAFTDLFGRRIDLVKRALVEQSPDSVRKQAILNSAKVIYAS
jgi:prevent-host-death family protein